MNQVTSDKFRWMAFLSSILIALGHATKIAGETGGWFISLCQQLAVPAMVYFFMSSAYFHYREYDKTDYITKLKKRIQTMVIPYACWNFIAYFIAIWKGYTVLSLFSFAKAMSFVYIPIYDKAHEPIIGATWFIVRLLTYEIIAPVFIRLIRNKRVFWMVMIVNYFIVFFTDLNYYAILYWMPFYLTAAYMAYYYHETIEQKLSGSEEKFTWKSFSFLFVFFIYGIFCMGCRKIGMTYDLERFCSIAIILFCMYFINWYPKVTWIVKKSPFYLYIIHLPLIWICGDWVGAHFQGKCSPSEMLLILFGIILIITYTSQWILYKAFPKLFMILTGNR